VPDAKLDLHGMTQAQAHHRLATFLHRAFDHDLRCVLVVTGKGGGRSDRDDRLASEKHSSQSHGVLRSMVPRWLNKGFRSLAYSLENGSSRESRSDEDPPPFDAGLRVSA
jgi:DNA-nicking Smr family endonuclease